VWLLAFGDDGLLGYDLLDKLVDVSAVSGTTYSAHRLSKSMDLVYCSPFPRMYSSRMPGG
jgi:hypothetical protein